MHQELSLKGKNILVTGGAGVGIGGGICQAVSQFGGRVIVNDLDQEVADKAAAQYPNAIAVQADVSKADEVAEMFSILREKCGIVHGLVNNAGIGLSKKVHEVTEAEFDRLYGVDVRAVWLVSRSFVGQLLDHQETGNIVNISSVHGFATQSGYSIYASAKAAVEGFTRGMAVELGPHNIRCNAIGPGYVHAAQNYDLIRNWADDPEEWVESYRKNQQALPFFIENTDCGNVVAFCFQI